MAIPFIPLLTAGLSLIGGALGKTSNQSSSEVTDSIIKGTTAQSQDLTSTTTQNQTGTQTQQSTDTATGKTTESVNRLDTDTKNLLTQAVRQALQGGGSGTTAIESQIAEISNPASTFDADAFVTGIMDSARADAASSFGSNVNNIRSRIGANSGTNSMAALLEEKLARDTTRSLSGIEAQARGQAETIRQNDLSQRTGALTSLVGAQQNEAQGLLTALLQATQTSSGDSLTTNTGTTTGTTTQTGTEKTDQKQSSTGVTGQTQKTSSAASGTGQENDWGDFLSSIGDIFKAKF